MIRVDVEDYCHACQDFSPNVIKPQKVRIADRSEVHVTDTIVQCEYRKRCTSIERYLRRQLKREDQG